MYYGDKKVTGIAPTADGRQLVELEDKSTVSLSSLMAGAAITDDSTDLSKLREIRCYPVVAEVLSVMHKWDIQLDEVGFVLSRVKMSIEQSHEQALNVLLGVENSGDELMSDVDRILKGKVNPDKVTMEDTTNPEVAAEAEGANAQTVESTPTEPLTPEAETPTA